MQEFWKVVGQQIYLIMHPPSCFLTAPSERQAKGEAFLIPSPPSIIGKLAANAVCKYLGDNYDPVTVPDMIAVVEKGIRCVYISIRVLAIVNGAFTSCADTGGQM